MMVPSAPRRIALFLALAGAVCPLTGCGGGHDPEHGDGHDHDHADDASTGGHGHVHVAPHGGVLVPLGEESAHVELLLEGDLLTAWLLDAEAEKPLRSAQDALAMTIVTDEGAVDVRLEPVASALTGETVGDTSQFQTTATSLVGVDLAHVTGSIARVEVLGAVFEAIALEPE